MATKDDPPVFRIWTKWHKNGSSSSPRKPSKTGASHSSEHTSYHSDLWVVNLTVELGLTGDFHSDAMLACKLLFADPAMDLSKTNFKDLAGPDPRRSQLSQNRLRPRAKRRRAKVPVSSADARKRPAVGTLARTRNLVLAALRVWELKQGIRS